MIDALSMKNITYRYQQDIALRDVSLTFPSPMIYGLIGRNGAGKTTLLSLLASYRKSQEGTLRFGEAELFENRDAMERINFVYPRDLSDEDDTVRSYFKDCARLRPHFDMAEAERLASLFHLSLDKKINALSAGMQSCVNVIEGLAANTDVTMFDEVHLNMDAVARTRFYEELLKAQEKRPRIMILSTHLVSEMAYLFDHVIILDKGKIIVDENPDSLLDKGISLTGKAADVDAVVNGLTVLGEKRMGPYKEVAIYGTPAKHVMDAINEKGLEVKQIPLQDLFVHLTKEDMNDA